MDNNNYQKSIDRLNMAIGMEISSTLQYMFFHVVFDDAGYEYLARYFKMTAITEMKHTELLAERILFLEGSVVMDQQFKTKHITDVKDALQFSMQLERSTVDKYNEWSRLCSEEDDAVTHRIFQNLSKEEEEHLDAYRTEMQNMIDYGKDYLALQSFAQSKKRAGE